MILRRMEKFLTEALEEFDPTDTAKLGFLEKWLNKTVKIFDPRDIAVAFLKQNYPGREVSEADDAFHVGPSDVHAAFSASLPEDHEALDACVWLKKFSVLSAVAQIQADQK
jgi:hypothetical protein